MSRTFLYPDAAASESLDELSRRRRLRRNLRAFFSRLLGLACEPRRFAPLVIDCYLLIQSTWNGKQFGPDVVYPFLSIRKRQSGRLARLILEHSRDHQSYELHASKAFPKGIDPPRVAVMDLDKVSHDVVRNGYSTQVDLYGLMSMLMLFETIVTLIVHTFYARDQVTTRSNWFFCAIVNLFLCWYTVFRGDGTLTLARRSDAPTPGCGVLLDQDLTVFLIGGHGVIEAIAESGFNLSHDNFVWRFRLRPEDRDRDISYDILEAFCEAVFLSVFALCWLVFQPLPTPGTVVPMAVVFLMSWVFQRIPPEGFTSQQQAWFILLRTWARISPAMFILALYEQVVIRSPLYAFHWLTSAHLLSVWLLVPFSAGYSARNYPIRSAKFLDALGHPPIRKWEFDTLAAAATFQCLVMCHGIPRPVADINVLAFLDMLIPDERDVWTVWKKRVADRVVHEEDISFTPTIPMFRDGRQQQLLHLLGQAQFGHDTYRASYV